LYDHKRNLSLFIFFPGIADVELFPSDFAPPQDEARLRTASAFFRGPLLGPRARVSTLFWRYLLIRPTSGPFLTRPPKRHSSRPSVDTSSANFFLFGFGRASSRMLERSFANLSEIGFLTRFSPLGGVYFTSFLHNRRRFFSWSFWNQGDLTAIPPRMPAAKGPFVRAYKCWPSWHHRPVDAVARPTPFSAPALTIYPHH